ncbi:hypothetical protein FA15DRAFT_510041 [Coprinopsis marcescibilis]|uniref:F-box domain-containing protein n=1 Tax=Coprinopsis marcescibilis TaxID=230819 RepID=A0A5C3KQ53_COPMA|nr:hypothetical protein FA15DRAFT_510041 [Coprinopsis marcescibilis]
MSTNKRVLPADNDGLGSTSPSSALPAELFEHIFLYVTESPRNAKALPKGNPLTEVTLSHVCSKWRTVAIRCTRLWCYITNDGDDREHLPERFRIYLERSKDRLLEISVSFCSYLRSAVLVEQEILEILAECSSRWRCVSISVTDYVDLMDERGQFRTPLRLCEAPRLEFFKFSINSGCGHHFPFRSNLKPNALLGGCPKLSYLQLDDSSLSAFLPQISNVTVLDIDISNNSQSHIAWPVFLDIAKLPLTALSVIDHEQQGLSGLQLIDFPIDMPHLKHLRWTTRNAEENCIPLCSVVITLLRAPSLETLSLFDVSLEDILDNPRTWIPNLRSMVVVDCQDISSECILNLSSASPNLTDLVIVTTEDCHPRPRSLLSCIGELSESRSIEAGEYPWPKLRTIVAHLEQDPQLDIYRTFARRRFQAFIACGGDENALPPLMLKVPEKYLDQWAYMSVQGGEDCGEEDEDEDEKKHFDLGLAGGGLLQSISVEDYPAWLHGAEKPVRSAMFVEANEFSWDFRFWGLA